MGKLGGIGTFLRDNKYPVYVLVMCMLNYTVNQLATFCLIASNAGASQEIGYGDRVCDVSNQTAVMLIIHESGVNTSGSDFCMDNEYLCDSPSGATECADCCFWRYLGRGTQFQLLAGPLYIVLFAISGLPLGFISELGAINRKIFLGACVLGWSVMTILAGFSTQYWHLAITRIFTGIFAAGAAPLSASLISDYFSSDTRGAALGFFNWGIYLGYSMTFTLTVVAREIGWRWVYFIGGSPGILTGIITLVTIKEPERGQADGVVAKDEKGERKSIGKQLGEVVKVFSSPALLVLCLGGAVRNGAGLCWAYNMVNFFDDYHPGTNIEEWMTWIPLIFGSLGAFGGGFIADRVSKGKGPSYKLLVLMACLVLSAPFQVGTLFTPMPGAFLFQIPSYLIGEMWIGILIAIVVDLVPVDLTASAVAVYFFIIMMIGGNMNLLVTPIENSLGLRNALLITLPGFYLVAAVIFCLPLFILRKREAGERTEKQVMVTEIDAGKGEKGQSNVAFYLGDNSSSGTSIVSDITRF